jgi:hypothetical protein
MANEKNIINERFNFAKKKIDHFERIIGEVLAQIVGCLTIKNLLFKEDLVEYIVFIEQVLNNLTLVLNDLKIYHQNAPSKIQQRQHLNNMYNQFQHQKHQQQIAPNRQAQIAYVPQQQQIAYASQASPLQQIASVPFNRQEVSSVNNDEDFLSILDNMKIDN